MSRFVTTLRARPERLRLVSDTASGVWTVRVQCAEVYDAVRVDVLPDTSVRDVKHAAMAVLLPDVSDLDGYVVKLNGFEVSDERQSVQHAAGMDGSTFLITSRRRRPVR